MTPSLLFVYGTLRPGLGTTDLARRLHTATRHIGAAHFQGKLFQISWYPGATDSADPSDRVVGNLFDVSDAPDLLHALDDYEGCFDTDPQEYRREARHVAFDDKTTAAWVYIYQGSLLGCPRIESGDFSDA